MVEVLIYVHVGLLGTGAQDVHLHFHTAPELWGYRLGALDIHKDGHHLYESSFGVTVKQKAVGSIPLRLSFLFKTLWCVDTVL